ncbi:MAG: hypothetical protein HQ592_11065 [Planctomycetes bacterium]|jgi:predicted Ser/Thr protein kinase|nr:hypothetical protein [Planctomycetota bacterium]
MIDGPLAHDGIIEIDGEVYRHHGTLKRDAFARTELVEKDGKKYLFKVSRLAIFGRLKLRRLMNGLTGHEVHVHHLLEGVHGVPKLTRRVSENSFLREFVEGRTLDRDPPELRPDFFDEFHDIVRNIHARGVAFVDLAKKENVVVTTEGRPFLIDFQISISLSKSRWPPALLWNVIVRMMQRADIYHVFKHKRRCWPGSLTDEERRTLARMPWFNRVHKYVFRKPYHLIKRRFIPKHGDSEYPFYENE